MSTTRIYCWQRFIQVFQPGLELWLTNFRPNEWLRLNELHCMTNILFRWMKCNAARPMCDSHLVQVQFRKVCGNVQTSVWPAPDLASGARDFQETAETCANCPLQNGRSSPHPDRDLLPVVVADEGCRVLAKVPWAPKPPKSHQKFFPSWVSDSAQPWPAWSLSGPAASGWAGPL